MTKDRSILVIQGEPLQLNELEQSIRDRFPGLELRTSVSGDMSIQRMDDPLASASVSFALLFEQAPVALILVNQDREVLCLNRDAAALAGQIPKDMLGKITGVALCCPNASIHPDGCGHSPHCGECGLRQLIARSFETGQRQDQIEIEAGFGSSASKETRRLRVSSTLVAIGGRDETLLSIEEIHKGGIPPPKAAMLE
jgi:hypothetical protein